MSKAQLKRGEKWFNVRKEAEFKKQPKDVEWMDKQESIVNDIKAYEDSIKPPKEETKSKGKK